MGTIFPKRAPARGPALRAGFAIIIPQPAPPATTVGKKFSAGGAEEAALSGESPSP